MVIPKGFFPLQDTGHPAGHDRSRSERSRSAPWCSGSRRWPTSLRHDPDVESLSSFVGIDGTNTTLNNGRFLINLKPKDERSDSHPGTSWRG